MITADKYDNSLYKFLGIALLIIQQTCMPLLSYSTQYRITDERFLTTVTVLIGEIVKFLIASVIIILNEKSFKK
ncbi:Uncharacterized protein BM_BM17732 [Brugia malayi]|nr:Uncharacterized protein BM_BM17732 [Brugia malayi]VIO97857.1 Uncharacterized protein BM_BM17732 [Brugia malayi]